MSQGGGGSSLKSIVFGLLVALLVALAIGNAMGKKDGCEASGGRQRGLECVREEGK